MSEKNRPIRESDASRELAAEPAPEGHADAPRPERDRSEDGRPGNGRPGNGTRKGGSRSGPSRRDFLKLLGVTGAGAAAAGCSPPETTDKLIPYLIDPDDVTPGENTTYATVLADAGPAPLGIHAWVREGRAIMVEGNPDFPTNRGKVSALAQSALQDLYDPDRFEGPRRRSGDGFAEATWEEALAAAGQAVSGASGAVLLTGTATGTRDRFYGEWAEAMGAEHVRWEPLGLEAERRAQDAVFGRAEIPEYALGEADRIVSFGADFLGTWLAPVELAGDFARAREIDEGRLSKFTFVGPRLSVTGTNADEWLPARAGTAGLVALAAARIVAETRGGAAAGRVRELLVPYTPARVADRSGVAAERIRALGEELAAAERPVALPPDTAERGSADPSAHVAVALLNYVTGAVGRTLRFGTGPVRAPSATPAEMADLASRIRAGEVDVLVVAGTNPAYSVPASTGMREALGAATVLSLSPHPDETAMTADWVLPAHHELEAWGDAEVRPGVWALGQPVMRPVFDTRQREDALMGMAAAAGTDPEATFGAAEFSTYLQDAWRQKHAASGSGQGFEAWWEDALRRGGWWEQAAGPETPDLAADLTGADLSFPETSADGGFALTLFATPQWYDGRGANRGWMQELPDPVTKAVWGSWVELHPETAEPLGLESGDEVEVRSPAGTVRAPVYLNRGIRPDTVALPLGQGHTAYGRTAEGVGVNPLDLLSPDQIGETGLAPGTVQVAATGESGDLVTTQGADTDHGREIAELIGVETARRRVEEHEVNLAELVEAAWDSEPDSPYRWGMTIDLNACTGCGACVTACYAENNLPVVGKENVAEGREMSWLRVERYYEETGHGNGAGAHDGEQAGDGAGEDVEEAGVAGPAEGVGEGFDPGFQTVHEPMLCQHCGDAPCEPVCPVYATYHNPEGLNVQVYNRCVGTRYCSNNCPYKVRRFNWFSYDFPYPLNLQLNPDVTVRDKGVMEKCTFCVQRINRAKVHAKEEGRLVRDGEITTACQGACPTDAIVFGNLKDPTSRVSEIAKGARSYHVLGELHTRPAVTYLQDVTHAPVREAEGHGGGHGPAGAASGAASHASGDAPSNGHGDPQTAGGPEAAGDAGAASGAERHD